MAVPESIIAAVRNGGGNAVLADLLLGRERLRLAWTPQWYAQDSPLYGGQWASYYVLGRGPQSLRDALSQAGIDGVFYSGTDWIRFGFEVPGRIDRIIHSKLGDLRGLTLDRSIFRATLSDGSELIIDDEQAIGWCDRPDLGADDWNLIVEMTVSPESVRDLYEAWKATGQGEAKDDTPKALPIRPRDQKRNEFGDLALFFYFVAFLISGFGLIRHYLIFFVMAVCSAVPLVRGSRPQRKEALICFGLAAAALAYHVYRGK